MIGSVDFRENIIDPVLSRQLIGLRPDVDVKPPERGGMQIFREKDGRKPEDARRRSGNRKHLVDEKMIGGVFC